MYVLSGFEGPTDCEAAFLCEDLWGETIDLKIEVADRLWLGVWGGAVKVDTGAIAGAIAAGETIYETCR